MMSPEQFFELMLKELELHTEMQPYYKFLGSKSSWHFRRNYFLQRLRYIKKYIVNAPQSDSSRKNLAIWDCGCGYGFGRPLPASQPAATSEAGCRFLNPNSAAVPPKHLPAPDHQTP